MIDHRKEQATFKFLGEKEIAPKFCGSFRNGRLEQWLEGFRALELGDLSHPKASALAGSSSCEIALSHIA